MPYPVLPDVPANTMTPLDGGRATYSAAITGLVAAASATDIFTLTGSASKTVRITRVEVSGTATTAGNFDVQFLKRSTADTSGTSTAPTAVSHDSNNAAASAVVAAYTANPTVGTLVGVIRTVKLFLNVAATGASTFLGVNFGDRPSQDVVLRGATQVFAVNLNAGSPAGSLIDIAIEWTEDAS